MEEEHNDYSGSAKPYDPNEFEASQKKSAKIYSSTRQSPKRDLSFTEFMEEVKKLRGDVASKK